MISTRVLAREWLLFLGAFAVGFVVVPPLLVGGILGERVPPFYRALVGGANDPLLAWLIVLAPYLLVQLIRSAKWAVSQTRP